MAAEISAQASIYLGSGIKISWRGGSARHRVMTHQRKNNAAMSASKTRNHQHQHSGWRNGENSGSVIWLKAWHRQRNAAAISRMAAQHHHGVNSNDKPAGMKNRESAAAVVASSWRKIKHQAEAWRKSHDSVSAANSGIEKNISITRNKIITHCNAWVFIIKRRARAAVKININMA